MNKTEDRHHSTQTIGKLAENVLATMGHSTRTRQTTAVKPCAPNVSFTFNTFGDVVLAAMLRESLKFSGEIQSKSTPRWLTLLGSSGTGKTFLATQIMRFAKTTHLRHSDTLIQPIFAEFWPAFINQLRDGEHWRMRDAADANFLLLDEVVADRDPSGFVVEKLCELLSRRVGKWTVITSNATQAQLSAWDARVTSRMNRGGSVVMEIMAMDYAMRY